MSNKRENDVTETSVKTTKLEESELLGKVEEFLPKMKKANEDLEEEIAADPEAAAKYNIENVDGDEKVVEMNVNVGVLEEKKDGEEEALDLKLPGGEKSEKPLVEPLDDEEEDAIEEEEEEEEEVSEYSEDEEEEDEDVYSESD